jgi:hypothetical protein
LTRVLGGKVFALRPMSRTTSTAAARPVVIGPILGPASASFARMRATSSLECRSTIFVS